MRYRNLILLTACIFLTCGFAVAQPKLDTKVSVDVRNKKISDLLTTIGKQGGFYFSYASNWVATDSLVTITASAKPVRDLLDQLFTGKVDYKEAPGYIILRPAPYRLSVFSDKNSEPDHDFVLTGYVTDQRTETRLADASVFEPHVLLSTVTDRNGNFKLKVKYDGPITLIVSKELYRDTSINILNTVTIYNKPRYYYSNDTSYRRMERSWLGRMFISSRQRVQSLNIGNFISTLPVQASLTPGLSSHGIMSSQIVNSASLNLLGGYTAGVKGMELAGLFNINKADVRYVQAAGLFNLTSGAVTGVQMSGLSNTVYKSVNGVQAAGLVNVAKDSLAGAQLAGFANGANATVKGIQAAGFLNISRKNLDGAQFAGLGNAVFANAHGIQAAGLFNAVKGESAGAQFAGLLNFGLKNRTGFQAAVANISLAEVKGMQLGIINVARKLNGFHLGLVNIADSLTGTAMGIANFSKNGYHQVSVYTDEALTTSISFKTGNHNLYSRLIGGYNFTGSLNCFVYGGGLGHDFVLSKNKTLATELSYLVFGSGRWDYQPQLLKFSIPFHYQISAKLGLVTGPSVVYRVNSNQLNFANENAQLSRAKIAGINLRDNNSGWIGWTAGITVF